MRFLPLVVVLLVVRVAVARACPELPSRPTGRTRTTSSTAPPTSTRRWAAAALTAAFSRCGELTVLKWPGPSYYNQLNYLSSNAPDARTQPHLGALDDQGAFPGLAYRTRRAPRVHLAARRRLVHTQRYSADASDVLVDEAVNAALGVRVTARSLRPARPQRAGEPVRGAARPRVAGARRHAALLHQPRADPGPAAALPDRRLGARLPERLRRRLRHAASARCCTSCPAARRLRTTTGS